jgi:hypothetical protein
MEFLKNHYEKVILSVVLLGLAVVVAILPMKVPSGVLEVDTTTPRNKVVPLDLKTNEIALLRLEKYKPLSLTGAHNLFNPVQWRRLPDMSLMKITSENQVGPGAVRINKISPLYFILSYEGYNPPRFQIGVTQEAHKNANLRGRMITYAQLNEKNEYFTITDAAGPTENPTELTLLLNDRKTATLTKDKKYQAVAGYTADLGYPPENRSWLQRRIGDQFTIDQGQETNKIVDISSNEVVLSSSSGKRTKIKYQAAQ